MKNLNTIKTTLLAATAIFLTAPLTVYATEELGMNSSINEESAEAAVLPLATVTPNVPIRQAIPPPAVRGVYGYPQTQARTTIEAAQRTALDRVGGGTVVRVETKYPKHGMEYKIFIVNGDSKYDVHVDANSGMVRKFKMDQITKVGSSAYYNNATAAISSENAKSIAIQKAGGSGVVTDCKLDYKRKRHIGALTYHIHVANGQYEYCVELDATTGNVYKVEQRYKP